MSWSKGGGHGESTRSAVVDKGLHGIWRKGASVLIDKGERRDGRSRGNRAVFEHRIGPNPDPFPQMAMVEDATAGKAAFAAHGGAAADLDITVDDGVLAENAVRCDQGSFGSQQGNPFEHQLTVVAELEGGMGLGQLDPGIDAKDIKGLVVREFVHCSSLAVGNGDDIGQINLALAIVVSNLAKRREQELAVDQVNARIDFLYLSLFFGGVFFFDNGRYRALGITEYAAVAKGLVEQGGHQGQGGLLLPVRDYHGLEGGCLDQRGVAAENHHLCCVFAGRFRAEHGMACTLLLFLDHRGNRVALECAEDFLALVPDDDCTLRDRRFSHCIQHMVDHRPEEDFMQHLGVRGFHAGAFAGGEDNSGNRWGHGSNLAKERNNGNKWSTVEKKQGFDKGSLAECFRNPPP